MIRDATVEDVPDLVKMGCVFVETSTYRMVSSIDPGHLQDLMTSLIDNTNGLLLVSETDGVKAPRHLSGMLGMVVYHHPLSNERVANEMFWWVNPEDRGTSDAVRLLRQGEHWAKDQDAFFLYVSAPDEKVGSIFQRLGYMPLEVQYVKQVTA